MKLSNLYEEAMSEVYIDFDYDEDGVEIKALKDRKTVGYIDMKYIIDAHKEFEDVIERGEFSEEDYIKLFPNDRFAEIDILEVINDERGRGYAKMLVQNAISEAKKEGYKVMYLNASPMGDSGMGIDELVGFYKSFGFETFIKTEHNEEMFLNI